MPVNRFTEGASAERKARRRSNRKVIADLRKNGNFDATTLQAVEDELEAAIVERVKRGQQRKGGIGRK